MQFSKVKLVSCAIVLAVVCFLIIVSIPQSQALSAVERGFVGTWGVLSDGTETRKMSLTLRPDRTYLVDDKVVPDCSWSIADGLLNYDVRAQVSLFGATIPGTYRIEVISWDLFFVEHANRGHITRNGTRYNLIRNTK